MCRITQTTRALIGKGPKFPNGLNKIAQSGSHAVLNQPSYARRTTDHAVEDLNKASERLKT